MAFRALHISLSVEVDGDAVCGHADDGCCPPRPFTGWMGLIAALDALLDDHPADPPGSAPSTTPE